MGVAVGWSVEQGWATSMDWRYLGRLIQLASELFFPWKCSLFCSEWILGWMIC